MLIGENCAEINSVALINRIMAKRTPSQGDNPTYYALFRKDGMTVEQGSALQDQIYGSLFDAQTALAALVADLPTQDLRNKIIIKQVIKPPDFNENTDLRWYVVLE